MYKKNLILIAFALIDAVTSFSFIDFSSGELVFSRESATYVLPNENYPELAIPIWEKSTDGVYVSVGAERAFIGAALSNATHLLALDRDSGIVAYNRMIIALLKMADDGEDFLRMRTDFSYLTEKIKAAQSTRGDLDFSFIEYMQTNEVWQLLVKKSPCRYDSRRLHWMWRREIERSEVRYWENPKLFAKLKSMAMENKIQAEKVNFGDTSALSKIKDGLARANLKISVIDFSNTQKATYLGPIGIDTVVRALDEVLVPESILLVTWFEHKDFASEIEYAGFRRKDFQPEVFEDSELFKKTMIISLTPSLCASLLVKIRQLDVLYHVRGED